MRIIFMGSPIFAVPTLDALVAAGHEVVAVYTQPPRPAGRGKGERATAVAMRARELGIAVRSPRTLRDAGEQAAFAALAADVAVVAAYGLILPQAVLDAPTLGCLNVHGSLLPRWRGAALGADVAVVAAYGLILPQAVLDAPTLGCLNVHGSLLPRWRGAAPVQRAIMAGDAVTGVTIMRMEAGLDTGPMLLRREIAIGGKNAAQVMEELGIIGAALMVETLASATLDGEPQPDEGVTYAAKISKDEARIDWTRRARDIVWQVQGLAPFPGAWFEVAGERIKLLSAEAVAGMGASGEVIDDALTIACGDGAIRPTLLQRAGRSPMQRDDLLRGFAVRQGTRLT